jgi:thioredoxin-like negative regulator of GroEL
MAIFDILKTGGVIAVTALSQMSGIMDSTKNGKSAIINVYSEFCGYSQMMANVYVKYVPLNAGKSIDFYGVDANKIEGVTGDYKIRGVPTFIGLACGKEVDRVTGADEEGLSRLITKLDDIKC